jgi:hypothetical protein
MKVECRKCVAVNEVNTNGSVCELIEQGYMN